MALTAKRMKFLDIYARLGNLREAAREAGYKDTAQGKDNGKNLDTVAWNILRDPECKAYLDKLNEELKKETIAPLDEVLEFITSIIRNDKVDVKERLSAADKRLKTLGAYLERVKTEGTTNINVTIDDYTDIVEETEDE